MKVYMGAYEGRSPVSWVIQKTTRHWCSHISAIREDSSVIEAWHKGGVVERAHFNRGHTDGTVIHLYEIRGLSDSACEKMWRGLSAEIGKEYDHRAILSFATRSASKQDPDKWICSELFTAKAYRVGCELQRCPSFKIPPSWCVRSPLSQYVGTIVTGAATLSAAVSQQAFWAPPPIV